MDTELKLRPFQREGVRLIEAFEGRALLADDMGLGKTPQILRWLERHEDALPAVIVVPAYLKLNWKKEARRWTSLTRTVLSGTRVPEELPPRDLYIINYDILRPAKCKRGGKTVVNEWTWPRALWNLLRYRTVVLDECQMVMNQTALRSKGVEELCSRARHLVAASGTPIENCPYEIYNTINLIKPTLFPNRFEFGMRYCKGTFNGYSWVFKGAAKTQELHDILVKNVMIRRRKMDVLKELPPKNKSIVPLAMEPEDVRNYRHAETDFKAWIHKQTELTAEDIERRERGAALAQLKALQLLSAAGKFKAASEWARGVVLEKKEPLILFSFHKSIAHRLTEELTDCKPVLVTGETPLKVRQKNVEDFQAGRYNLFIGTMGAAGVGTTLTRASHVGILEFPWSPSKLDQAEDRSHRLTQTRPVWVWYLVAEGTIDEHMMTVLDRKRKIMRQVLDGQKASQYDMLTGLLKIYQKETQ